MNTQIQRLNPHKLLYNPVISQIVTTEGNGKTIYISGQNGINPDGNYFFSPNIQKQTHRAMQNIQIALTSCGATFENVVKLSIHIVTGESQYEFFEAYQNFMNGMKPPAISFSIVAGLIDSRYSIEIDAIAFIPE